MRIVILCLVILQVTAVEAVSNTRTGIIDLDQTRNLLAAGAAFIDNRPEHMYANGHIEGAVNLPFFQKNHPASRMTRENLLAAIGSKTVVVFYCSGAYRAYHAMMQASDWGMKAHLYWYKNGMKEWLALQLPVSK